MFDPFGIKKRKAERAAQAAVARQKMLDEREARLESRKAAIDKFLDEKEQIANEQAKVAQERDEAEVAQKNTVCPVCGSKNRIHKFVRTKGQLDGSLGGSSSGYSSLFGGYSHGSISGKIHGELDTFEVNECKDCGNQWKVVEPRHKYLSDYRINTWSLDESEGNVGFLYRSIRRYREEPKKMEDLNEYSVVREFKDTPRMVLEYLLFSFHLSWRGYGVYDGDDDHYILYNTPIHYNEEKEDFNGDPYLFEFSEEDWDFIKRVVGYETE